VTALPRYNFAEIVAAIHRADYAFVLKNAMQHAVDGNASAQCAMALVYQAGWGVQADVLEAERWLLKATAQNSAAAWHNLGTLYAVKHPGLKDRWGNARKCLETAKKLGFDGGELYANL
jgi:TPR repeat protein